MAQSFMFAREIEDPLAIAAPPGITLSALSEAARAATAVFSVVQRVLPGALAAIRRPSDRKES